MKAKTVKSMMKEYDQKYGSIPDNIEDLISYILTKYPKINAPNWLEDEIERIENIKWEHDTYTVDIIPKPAARPRYAFETKHFYVPGAATNKALFKKILGISDNLIMARTSINLMVYQPTPEYKMTQKEILLAELGYIRPVIDPDIDNFIKAYLDAIQGVLIADDNIITDITASKRFSVKPRIELIIHYMKEPDSNYTRKILEERIKKIESEKTI